MARLIIHHFIFAFPPSSPHFLFFSNLLNRLKFNSVQSLSHVSLFATPWTAACQASLSNTNSQSLLKLMSIELVMPSNHVLRPQHNCTVFWEVLSYWLHAAAKSLQSCPTLCDPIDGSPAGSPVPGILQARTLEWGAIAFSAQDS